MSTTLQGDRRARFAVASRREKPHLRQYDWDLNWGWSNRRAHRLHAREAAQREDRFHVEARARRVK